MGETLEDNQKMRCLEPQDYLVLVEMSLVQLAAYKTWGMSACTKRTYRQPQQARGLCLGVNRIRNPRRVPTFEYTRMGLDTLHKQFFPSSRLAQLTSEEKHAFSADGLKRAKQKGRNRSKTTSYSPRRVAVNTSALAHQKRKRKRKRPEPRF